MWLAGSIAVLHAAPRARPRRRRAVGRAPGRDLARLPRRLRVVPPRPADCSALGARGDLGRRPGHPDRLSLVVLVAMGVNPLSLDSVRQSDAAGGHLVGRSGHRRVQPDPGAAARRRPHREAGLERSSASGHAGDGLSPASSSPVGALRSMFRHGPRRASSSSSRSCCSTRSRSLQATSKPGPTGASAQRSADVEAAAWQTGRPGVLEPGQRLSPWFEAHRALLRATRAGRWASCWPTSDPRSTGRWIPPTAATPEQLPRVVARSPPTSHRPGNEYSARVLAEILLAVGRRPAGRRVRGGGVRRDADPRRWPRSSHAPRRRLGDDGNALRWLGAAVDAAVDRDRRARRACWPARWISVTRVRSAPSRRHVHSRFARTSSDNAATLGQRRQN